MSIQTVVIIPVKNDRRILKTLDKLVDQEKVTPYEIIVIDASSNNQLDDIRDMFKGKVRWVKYTNKSSGKRSTVSQVNRGINLTTSDIIAFIDADCIPEKDWLYQLILPILEENESFCAGYVKSLNESTYMDVFWSKKSEKTYVDFCPNMNSAIKRSLITELGLYDDINYNYGWDVDFAWRAGEAGYKIRFVNDAIIYHDWGNFHANIKRNYYYGIAKVRLYLKHKRHIKNIVKNDFYAIKYPILILSLPFIIIFPLLIIPFSYLCVKDVIHIKSKIHTIIYNFAYGFGIMRGVVESLVKHFYRPTNS